MQKKEEEISSPNGNLAYQWYPQHPASYCSIFSLISSKRRGNCDALSSRRISHYFNSYGNSREARSKTFGNNTRDNARNETGRARRRERDIEFAPVYSRARASERERGRERGRPRYRQCPTAGPEAIWLSTVTKFMKLFKAHGIIIGNSSVWPMTLRAGLSDLDIPMSTPAAPPGTMDALAHSPLPLFFGVT